MKIFSCRATRYLAQKLPEKLGVELGQSSVTEFSDGEFQPCFNESVRGEMVFIVQSTNPPADNLFELLLMIDAAKRASTSLQSYCSYSLLRVCTGRTGKTGQECRLVQNYPLIFLAPQELTGLLRWTCMLIRYRVFLMSLLTIFTGQQFSPHTLKS